MADTKPETNRTWMYIGLAFLAFWVIYLSFFAPGNRQPLENSALDVPANYDWSLEDLSNQQVPFSRFKGKTVFLNIWATWCGPCVGEMPSIARLAANPVFKGKNIEFVCVSVDDSTEKVVNFIRGRNWPMTVLRARSLPRLYETDGIPATFVLTPEGRIAAAEVGASDWDNPKVVAFLEKAALGKPPAVDPAAQKPAGSGG